MTTEDFDYVPASALRVGLFVDLQVGWMDHPFPTSRFKITHASQIETLRGLRFERIRFVPSKSDPAPVEASARTDPQLEKPSATVLRQKFSAPVQAPAATQDSAQCERRFAEAASSYRKSMETLDTDPLEAARLCHSLVQGLTSEMEAFGEVAIRLLTDAAGDKVTMHPVNVSVLSLLLGKAMGLSGEDLVELGLAALLHDIGKAQLPERVRRLDPGFSAAEHKVYQEHVSCSVRMARDMALSQGAVAAIAQHHELVDGTGFPLRLKGDALSLNARILGLVNRYDGLCNATKAGTAMTPHEALAFIFSQQKARFDGAVLSAFIRMLGVYPPGSVVQLNDERLAMVVAVNSARPLKPRVLVMEPSVPKHLAALLDLEHAPNTSIRRSLKPSSLSSEAMLYLQPKPRNCYFFESAANTAQVQLSA